MCLMYNGNHSVLRFEHHHAQAHEQGADLEVELILAEIETETQPCAHPEPDIGVPLHSVQSEKSFWRPDQDLVRPALPGP